MPFVWIARRVFLFTAVRLLRLWSFFWRGDHQRFLWRLRRNNVVRLSPELFQHCLITTPFTAVMSKAKQPRARRWLARVGRCALLALLFLLSFTFNLPWSTQHMAIISSNYYPHSASNPPNTMVVLFNAQRRFWPPWPLLCRSFNGSHSLTALARVRYAFTPILICGWSVYLASCPTVQPLINEARVANEWEDPKYVVKPANVQSVWLHWPGIINRGRMYTVPAELNFMLHFRNWSMIDFHSSAYPRTQRTFELFTYQMADMLQPARAVELERNFHDFLAYTPELAELFARLPSRVVYYPLVADCYNRIFYDRSKHPINCPGPVRCDLPSLPGLKCAVAKRRVAHLTINRHLNVHVPLDASGTFHISDNGCSWT
uniref:Glycosyltransferase family 92 protein n=1 Tax=Globodera pallida TaxID=36090 RepID=A0A183BWZ1_GLOPA